VSISVGVVTPMVLKGSGLFRNAPSAFSQAGLAVLMGAAMMVSAYASSWFPLWVAEEF
jgi:hypothetical protein